MCTCSGKPDRRNDRNDDTWRHAMLSETTALEKDLKEALPSFYINDTAKPLWKSVWVSIEIMGRYTGLEVPMGSGPGVAICTATSFHVTAARR